MVSMIDMVMNREHLPLLIGTNATRFACEHRDMEEVSKKWSGLIDKVGCRHVFVRLNLIFINGNVPGFLLHTVEALGD